MARYFFDISDGVEIRDEIGRDLPDIESLRDEAVKVIAGLLVAESEDSDGHTLVLNVRDRVGNSVMSIRTVCQIDIAQAVCLAIAS